MANHILHSVMSAAMLDPSGGLAKVTSMTEVVQRTLRPLTNQPDDAPENNLLELEEAPIQID